MLYHMLGPSPLGFTLTYHNTEVNIYLRYKITLILDWTGLDWIWTEIETETETEIETEIETETETELVCD